DRHERRLGGFELLLKPGASAGSVSLATLRVSRVEGGSLHKVARRSGEVSPRNVASSRRKLGSTSSASGPGGSRLSPGRRVDSLRLAPCQHDGNQASRSRRSSRKTTAPCWLKT